jgi:rfaE bifunctional protein kinase chain/domain
MKLIEEIKNWKGKNVLIIGEALVDKYISGFADKISPDAPVPVVDVENTQTYLGGIGLVLQFVKSLGGNPKLCTVVGNDFEGQFFYGEIQKLIKDSSGIIVDDSIKTPQITRIKAMKQHLLRLETNYSQEISKKTIDNFLTKINNNFKDIDSILILNYGIGNLFEDVLVQELLGLLRDNFDVPIIARPNLHNYYLYENVDLIKMTLHKALRALSIDCCTETSVSIVGKRILNATGSESVLLNDIESESYLIQKGFEKVKKFNSVLQNPVRSYVSAGSVIMASLGLSLASKISIENASEISLFAATLSATLPPVEFYDSKKLIDYINQITN